MTEWQLQGVSYKVQLQGGSYRTAVVGQQEAYNGHGPSTGKCIVGADVAQDVHLQHNMHSVSAAQGRL